jgi:hypothetical protein
MNFTDLIDSLKNLKVVEKLHESESARFGDISQEEISKYLNELRKSGVTNMFGATPYIVREFNISEEDAKKALMYWMKNFKRNESKINEINIHRFNFRVQCPNEKGGFQIHKCKTWQEAIDLQNKLRSEGNEYACAAYDEEHLKESKVSEAECTYCGYDPHDPDIKKEWDNSHRCERCDAKISAGQCREGEGLCTPCWLRKKRESEKKSKANEHCGHCAEDMKKKAKKVVKSVKKSK